MDVFIICNEDYPNICASEVKELINKESEIFPGLCVIPKVSPKELAILSYRLQSAYRIGILLAKENNLEDLENNFSKIIDINSWDLISEEVSSFAIETIKLVDHPIPSPDISASFGSVFKKFAKNNGVSLDVNLTKPDFVGLVFIGDGFCGVGIDIIGFDLSKRPYKLFHHKNSLNGVFAYTVSRLAGVKKTDKVLDPFTANGVLPIEIALFQQEMSSFLFERQFFGLRFEFSKKEFDLVEEELKLKKPQDKKIHAFDQQLKIMLGAKKNAKIAGVLDAIECSKVDVDWLDSKFEKNDIDIIITNPPKESKRLNNLSKILKIYDELFYQARFVLKTNGIMALLVFKPEQIIKLAEKHKLKVIDSILIHNHKQEYFLVICKNVKVEDENLN